MPSASLSIKLEKPAKEYIKVLGAGAKYKRGSVSFKAHGGTLKISVEADDAVALLASLGSAIKNIGVVASVGSLLEGKRKAET